MFYYFFFESDWLVYCNDFYVLFLFVVGVINVLVDEGLFYLVGMNNELFLIKVKDVDFWLINSIND